MMKVPPPMFGSSSGAPNSDAYGTQGSAGAQAGPGGQYQYGSQQYGQQPYGQQNGQQGLPPGTVTGVPVGYPTSYVQPTGRPAVVALGPDGQPLPPGTAFIGPDGRRYTVGADGQPVVQQSSPLVCGCGAAWVCFIVGFFFPIIWLVGSFVGRE